MGENIGNCEVTAENIWSVAKLLVKKCEPEVSTGIYGSLCLRPTER
jgi:hypothetical protein